MSDLNILEFGEGGGVPAVLIHGFTGDGARWVMLEEPLGAHHKMYAMEMPNHGGSPKRPIADFDALVAEVLAAFDALALPRAHVVGHSLGGAVATALAAARPEQAASLSLLGPAGFGPRAAYETLKGLSTATAPEDLRHLYKRLVYDPALVTDEWVELATEIRAEDALRAAQASMGEALFPGGQVSFDVVPVLGALALPTQIIWGKEDAILDWQGALRAPGRVALHLFERMGHIPQLEATEAVADLLLRHFAGAERA
jgi:pyruvate dehydrogenase E2 component (dihydrolipoamide acetyltransferase)